MTTINKSRFLTAVMLSTVDGDLGLVSSSTAVAEATKMAQEIGEPITVRDPISDKIIATVEPGGSAPPLRSPAKPNKKQLTTLFIAKLKPKATSYVVWDLQIRGCAIRVAPTGRRSWYCVYARRGRTRWLHLGDASNISLNSARQLVQETMLEVARGGDPAAEKHARGAGTFGELHSRYVEEYAKKHNRSWAQAKALIDRHVLPRWGKVQSTGITRGDAKAMMASIKAPIAANQTLAAVSAVFTWAVKEELAADNPCKLVTRNPTQSRERVVADAELPGMWAALGEAGGVEGRCLKAVLLLGQRPGECARMRYEHLDSGGWWTLPGAPDKKLQWCGTKNKQTHKVWVPAYVREHLIGEGTTTGFVFSDERGRPVSGLDRTMRAVCAKLGIADDAVHPHDLRRTWGTTCVGPPCEQGREAMDLVMNHKKTKSVTDVYDRSDQSSKMKRVMEVVASRIIALAQGKEEADNVVNLR